MFAFLKRTFIVLLGLLLITVFIWYAGPYFAFADFRPLESEFARLVAIGVVIGIWLLLRLMKRLRAYRASDRLLTAVVAQPQPQAEKARTPADVLKLRERFEEAVGALKQQRQSGHSLYDLPWYVIIGAPGSGKTTALLNSGLKFPLEQRVGMAPFAASVERATATGGSLTKRSFSTPPAATRRRTPTRHRTAWDGPSSWRSFGSIARDAR